MVTFWSIFSVLVSMASLILTIHTRLTLLLPRYLEMSIPTLRKLLPLSGKIYALALLVTTTAFLSIMIAIAVEIIDYLFGMLA